MITNKGNQNIKRKFLTLNTLGEIPEVKDVV